MANKVDYAKMLVPELKELSTKRGLSNKGRKEDLIQRLVENEKAAGPVQSKSTPAAPTSESAAAKPLPAASSPAKPKAAPPAAATSPSKSASKPATAASKSESNTGKTVKPAAASTTADQKTATAETTSPEPANAKAPAPPTAAVKDKATTSSTEDKPGPESAPQDYSTGLPSTSVDEELERRKKRMAKFGPVDGASTDTDANKALERQKRFGGGADAGAGNDKVGLSRLDQALPERRKRGRGAEDGTEDAGASFEDAGLKRRRGGGGGRGRGGREKQAPRPEGKKVGGLAEADRIAAEKRKARFASK